MLTKSPRPSKSASKTLFSDTELIIYPTLKHNLTINNIYYPKLLSPYHHLYLNPNNHQNSSHTWTHNTTASAKTITPKEQVFLSTTRWTASSPHGTRPTWTNCHSSNYSTKPYSTAHGSTTRCMAGTLFLSTTFKSFSKPSTLVNLSNNNLSSAQA